MNCHECDTLSSPLRGGLCHRCWHENLFDPDVADAGSASPPRRFDYSCYTCDTEPAVLRGGLCYRCWLRLVLFKKILEQYGVPCDVFEAGIGYDHEFWDDLYRS